MLLKVNCSTLIIWYQPIDLLHAVLSRSGGFTWPVASSVLIPFISGSFTANNVSRWLMYGHSGHTFQINSSTYVFSQDVYFGIARSASNCEGMAVLNLRLAQYDKFYNGLTQQDLTEFLFMLLNIIDKGPVPYSEANNNFTTVPSYGVSLNDFLCCFFWINIFSVIYVNWDLPHLDPVVY